MSILGYSASYFLPEYWSNTPLYGEKIIPLIDYILSTDYENMEELAQAFYNIENKYRNNDELPLGAIEEIIDESGYTYIKTLLGNDETSIRLLVNLIVLIHQLKGTKTGIYAVLSLLKKNNNVYIANVVGEPTFAYERDMTTESYLIFNNVALNSDTIDIKLGLTTGTIEKEQCMLSVERHSLYLGLDNSGRIVLSVGNDRKNWNIAERVLSTITLESNKEYVIKFQYKEGIYYVNLSEDRGANYTTVIEVPSTEWIKLDSGILYLGVDGSTGTIEKAFKGEIRYSSTILGVSPSMIGEPTVSEDKIVADITTKDYISFDNLNLSPDEIEVKIVAKPTLIGEEQCILSSNNMGIYIGVDTVGRLVLSVGSDRKTWNILERAVSNRRIVSGKEYNILFAYNSNVYSLSVSEDGGKTYTTYISKYSTDTLNIESGKLYIGVDGSELALKYPFNGKLNYSDLLLDVENINITQWFEQDPIGEENTFMINSNLDIDIVSTSFFTKFSKFIRNYVYPSLSDFEAKFSLSTTLVVLPFTRQKITYVMQGDVEVRTDFLVKTTEESLEATDPFEVRTSMEEDEWTKFRVKLFNVSTFKREGATPLSADWLSLTEGGEPLTPKLDDTYTVVNDDEYLLRTFKWNEDTNSYEEIYYNISVYIREGATPFSADWLTDYINGSALTPNVNESYTVVTSGDYYNKIYKWDSVNSKYVELE